MGILLRRSPAAAALVGALLAASLACGSGPAAADPLPRARTVYVQGDSLTVGTLPYLRGALGRYRIHPQPQPSAEVGRSVAAGLNLLRADAPTAQTVLIALGTNDFAANPRTACGWIRRAREIVGPDATIYWVNIEMDSARYPNWPRVNAGLLTGARRDNAAQQARGSRGRTHILDWASYAADRRLPHAADGVHYGTAAYRDRARFYAGTVAGLVAFDRYVVD